MRIPLGKKEELTENQEITELKRIQAKDNKKTKKILEKSRKTREKFYKGLLKKAGAHKLSNQNEINECILEYASNNVVYPSSLSEIQYNDPDFMLKFLSVRPDMINICVPTENLRKNLDYMIEYIKLKFEYNTENSLNYNLSPESFPFFMRDFKTHLKNHDFLTKLHSAFPHENLLMTIWENVGDSYWPKEKALATAIILELPTSILAQQANLFGSDFLKYLPESHPQYLEFAESAIKKDGFKALKKVPLKYVKSDITLIIKALDKDGSQKFEDYLLDYLDPHKSSGYMCHGEWHDYQYFDNDCVELQRAVLDNTILWTTLSGSKHAQALRPNLRKSLDLAVKAGESYIAYKKLKEQAHTERTK